MLSPFEGFLERLQARLHEAPQQDLRLLVVIAGHNGAGKTTIYNELIADALVANLVAHINPDEVEQVITLDLGADKHTKDEFASLAAKEGARLRLQHLDQETNFSFETVFSDPVQDKVRFMADARRRGYLVVLFAVGLDSVELSKARVTARHAKGGHDVPPVKLEERYDRVLLNFAHGARVATLAIFFDNSENRSDDSLDTYWDIAFFENGELVVKDESPPAWWHQVDEYLQSVECRAM